MSQEGEGSGGGAENRQQGEVGWVSRGIPVGHRRELQFDSAGNPPTVLGRGLTWSAVPSAQPPPPRPLHHGPHLPKIASRPSSSPSTITFQNALAV